MATEEEREREREIVRRNVSFLLWFFRFAALTITQ
jgi:hypothetical protein